MKDNLERLQAELDFSFSIVNVDDDPYLEKKYNELVPVLLYENEEICHWHLDEKAFRAYLIKLS